MLALLLPLHALLGQAPAPLLPRDSLAVREAAREAQASFERRRRWMLPITPERGWSCDVTVGRFCYWYNELEPPAPPEPPSIREAREALLDTLAVLAARLPGDGWIAGQRVRYLGDQERHEGALAVARQCGAEPWWCAMLEGYALHRAGQTVEAERAFGRGLQSMPEAVRCRWNDLEPLLERGWISRYRDTDCAGRDALNDWILQLALPRVSGPGNGFRAEYWARRTFLAILDGAVTHHGSRLTGDLSEIVLRYGWATGFSRQATTSPADQPTVIGHEPKPAFQFLPDLVDDSIPDWDWTSRTARTRYALPGVTRIVPIEDPLIARFRRGPGTVVVAGFSAAIDTLFLTDGSAALGLIPRDGEVESLSSDNAPRGRGRLAAVTGSGDQALLGIEVTDPVTGAVAVYRQLIGPLVQDSAGFSLSDLLLYDLAAAAAAPSDLQAAVRAALPGVRIPEGAVGLYWEVYDLSSSSGDLDVSVEVEEVGTGFLTRVGRSLGLGRRPPPIRISWRKGEGEAGPVAAQTIELDLRHLSSGRYRIIVTVDHPSLGQRQARLPVRIMPHEE